MFSLAEKVHCLKTSFSTRNKVTPSSFPSEQLGGDYQEMETGKANFSVMKAETSRPSLYHTTPPLNSRATRNCLRPNFLLRTSRILPQFSEEPWCVIPYFNGNRDVP